jgi:hypothetical protein
MMLKVLAFAAGVCLLSCASAQAEYIGDCNITDYGEKVYYASCTELGPVLVEMKRRFPGTIITFTSYAWYRSTSGYYIVVNETNRAEAAK